MFRAFQRYVARYLHVRKLGRFLTFNGWESNWQFNSRPFFLAITYVLSTPDGSCKPILDIYVLRAFKWYKKLFNPMSFDPCNCPLKIRESIETPTPKVGAHLGVCGFIFSHYPTLLGAWNVTLEPHFWFAPLQAFTLVVSPRLRLWHLHDVESWMNSFKSETLTNCSNHHFQLGQ